MKESSEEASYSVKWMLEDIVKSGYDSIPLKLTDRTIRESRALHRCDPKTLCICDMIGWEVEE